MKKSILLFILVAILSTACDKTNTPLPLYSEQYNPEFDATADLNFAIDNANKTNRRILVMVGGNWCSWCRALDKFLNQDHVDISKILHKNFVLLKVYYGKGNYNGDFLKSFPRILGTPHFFVLETDGSLLHSQATAELEDGRSYDRLKMKAFLMHWKKPKQSK